MNFNLVEMYNGLLRFNKHILNELAEGLKHLPNLDGVSKGDSLIINEQGNPAWGSAAFIPTFENDSRGINFVGYVFYHTHTLIRKSIKYKIIRLVNSYLNREINKKEFKIRMCAYYGWLKHADAKNLLYKIQSLTGVRYSNWNGKRTNIAKYYGKYVRIIQVINYAKYLC